MSFPVLQETLGVAHFACVYCFESSRGQKKRKRLAYWSVLMPDYDSPFAGHDNLAVGPPQRELLLVVQR
ncbi:hypothetical protein [Caballeronia sp. HLA56]